MSVYTTDTIISIAKISQYLAAEDIAKLSMFPGKQIVPSLAERIYMVRKGVEFKFDKDPTNSTLELTGNYLYALCGKYGIRAKYILDNNSGGIIINPVTGVPINLQRREVQFVVGATNSPMNAGDTVYILNDTPIRTWVSVYADGTKLPLDETMRLSYTVLYNATNTIFTFNNGLFNGQEIDIVYWVGNAAVVPHTNTNYIVTQTYFTATVDGTTSTTALPELEGATIISVVKEILTLVYGQYSFDVGTNVITLLGGLSMVVGERLFITYSKLI